MKDEKIFTSMRGVLACSLLLSARERVDCRLDEMKSRIPLALPFSCWCIFPSPAPIQEDVHIFYTCTYDYMQVKTIYPSNKINSSRPAAIQPEFSPFKTNPEYTHIYLSYPLSQSLIHVFPVWSICGFIEMVSTLMLHVLWKLKFLPAQRI
jgi:hypothetical protein